MKTFLIQKVATERVTRQQLETHEVLAESHERVLEEGLGEKIGMQFLQGLLTPPPTRFRSYSSWLCGPAMVYLTSWW